MLAEGRSDQNYSPSCLDKNCRGKGQQSTVRVLKIAYRTHQIFSTRFPGEEHDSTKERHFVREVTAFYVVVT